MHSLSVVRERNIKFEHAAKTLANVFKEAMLVRNSRSLVDCFDMIKDYNSQVMAIIM